MMIMYLVLISILLFELYILTKFLKYYLLSPIYIYVIFAIISIISSVLYFYFFDDKISLFNLDRVSNKDFFETIKLYIIALICFLAGTITYYDLQIKQNKLLFNQSFSQYLFLSYSVPKSTYYVTTVLFFLITILYFITYGRGLLLREKYLPEVSRGLTIIIKILSFIQSIILGLFYKKNKQLSLFYFIFLILISIGTASRVVFLFYVLYSVLIFISGKNNLINRLSFFLNLLLAFFLLGFLIGVRSSELHGIVPYLKSISSNTNNLINSIYFNFYYSFIFGVYVTIGTLKKATLDWNMILVSINPLPGKLAGWYEYANDMRLNKFAPFSLHGRVFKTGILFTTFYFFILGIIFSFFEKVVRKLFRGKKNILAFSIVIILCLHIVYAFEYNMRASIRYLYYAYFFLLVAYIFRQVIKNLPKRKVKK